MRDHNAHQFPVCLVTGANRGLGFAICQSLARRGTAVVLTARDAQRGIEAATQIRDQGLQVDFHVLDVTDGAEIETLRVHIEQTYGGLHVLINNAGRGVPDDCSILNVRVDQANLALSTNCFAPLRLCQAFMPLLRSVERARIINVTSEASALKYPGRGLAAYRLSKACLNSATTLLAAELEGSAVSVNAICPGRMNTRMGSADTLRVPTEAAEAVVWLALDAPADLTGKFLRGRTIIPW